MTSARHADVLVVGAGPAGAAIAASLARRGIDVLLCDPAPASHWPATYGAWADDLAAEVPVSARFDHVEVTGHRLHEVGRAYAVIDNVALHGMLRAALPAEALVTARIARIEHEPTASVAHDAGGRSYRVRLVVDASGGGGSFVGVHPVRGQRPVQAAVGWVTPIEDLGAPPRSGTCVLMDWTPVDETRPPSFLYQLELPGGRLLQEETVLASSPAADATLLAGRLATRLGVTGRPERAVVERVHIPMRSSMPDRRSRTVGFGAAGGFVHPATGYSVARSLAAAEPVAAAIDDALVRGVIGAALARAAWHEAWPAHARRSRAVHDYGLDVISRMGAARTREFIDVFFDLPEHRWGPYMSGTAGPIGLVSAMAGVFANSSACVRRALFAGDWRRLTAAVTA